MLDTTSYARTPQDLSHFVYQAGDVGRLTTLSVVPVIAGDSYSDNMVGAFKLSPMRRNLSLDPKFEVFSFFVPHRHVYGDDWVDFLKKGASTPTTPNKLTGVRQLTPSWASYYGISLDDTYSDDLPFSDFPRLPKWRLDGLDKIYENYFRRPEPNRGSGGPNITKPTDFRCCHLKRAWNAFPQATRDDNQVLDSTAGVDLIQLNERAAALHVDQSRDLFTNRYRDVVDSFGGTTTADVDQRPTLISHSTVYGSGYDVDGTSEQSLGQYAGRVTTQFNHKVPRFFCREHGAIWTVAVCRFDPVVDCENHYLDFVQEPTYEDISGDSVLLGNTPRLDLTTKDIFNGHFYPTSTGNTRSLPNGYYWREHPHYVNARFTKLQGYPFLRVGTAGGINELDSPYITPRFYDTIFQTTQLQHWQVYSRSNCVVYRAIPSTRETLLADS